MSTTTIESLDLAAAQAALPDLIDILVDAVDSGASVGFLPPLGADEAHAYWSDVLADLPGGNRILLVARRDGRVVGTLQLDLAKRPNGRHRAEVQKLLVHRAARNQGIARALMIEQDPVGAPVAPQYLAARAGPGRRRAVREPPVRAPVK